MIRMGLVDRDGYWGILLGSILKVRDVQWVAYSITRVCLKSRGAANQGAWVTL